MPPRRVGGGRAGPSLRPQIEADLIEEVARLRGFDSIPEPHARPAIAGAGEERGLRVSAC